MPRVRRYASIMKQQREAAIMTISEASSHKNTVEIKSLGNVYFFVSRMLYEPSIMCSYPLRVAFS